MLLSEMSRQLAGRWPRRVFDAIVLLALASLNVNIVGPDPGDFLFPILLVGGLLLGYLRIRDLRFPAALETVFFGFLLFHIVSSIVGNPVGGALGHLASNVALFCFLKLYVVSPHRMRSVMLALLSGAVASSVFAVSAMLHLWSPPESVFFPVFEEASGRFSALLGESPILAVISTFLAVWVLDEALEPKLWQGYTALKTGLFVLLVFQVGVTLTRSGWLNLGVALVCYGVVELRRGRLGRKLRLASVVLLAGAAGLTLLWRSDYGRTFKTRIESVVDPTIYGYDESGRMTFAFTRRAINVAVRHPWGVGAGRTETFFQSELTGGNVGAHNTYVQIMSDNGWVSFVFFVSIVGYIGLAVVRRMLMGGGCQFGFSYQVLFSGLAGLAAEGMYHDLIGWNLAWLLPSLACVVLWPAVQRGGAVAQGTSSPALGHGAGS